MAVAERESPSRAEARVEARRPSRRRRTKPKLGVYLINNVVIFVCRAAQFRVKPSSTGQKERLGGTESYWWYSERLRVAE